MMLLTTVSFATESNEETGKYIYRTNTYDFDLIKKDPMLISDEDFFGVWDENGNVVIESYFDYEKFPGLAEVESAAKKSDYGKAKEELYKYYLPEKYNRVKASTGVSSNYAFETELQSRNMYSVNSGGLAIEITDFVGQEWQTVTANSSRVLEHVKNNVSAGSPYVTFVIASMDKSNTPAEIKSKDTDAPPTLHLVVNNVQKTFEVSDDSYISPGVNKYTNFGTEPILYAQEYGYWGHWSNAQHPWGDETSDTKRTYIKFDLSSLKTTDSVSSAALSFNARTAAGGDLEEKELFIFGWEDATWTESDIRWNSYADWLFFSCNEQEVWDFVTSNDVTTKGKLCVFHRGSKVVPLANMYDYSGNEEYAYTFLRDLMSIVYNVGGNNKDVMNALDMSNHVFNVTQGFIKVWGSKHMTPEIFTACLKHLYLVTDVVAVDYLEQETHWNNWGTNQTSSTYRFCKTFPELKRSSYWYDCTLRHNARLLDYGTYDDGVCIEQSIAYVGTYLATYDNALDTLYDVNTDEYGGFCADNELNVLKDVVVNMYYSMAPGYRSFGLADSADYGTSYKSTLTNWYGYLKKLGIDVPELQYVATDGKSGELPKFTSIGYPDARRTYMRTDWSSNAVALAFTAKGDNAPHGHTDIFHVSLVAYGRDLLVDPGYGVVAAMAPYMEQAAQHNTITVNGGDITKSLGYDSVEKEQELNTLYDLTTYQHAYVDNASNAERTVLFLKNQKFYIVSDYIQPNNRNRVNTYTQFWHMLPSANIYKAEDGTSAFRSNFESGANIIVSPVDPEGMSDVRFEYAKYAPVAGVFIDNQKGVYERRSSGDVKFGTVLYPLDGGENREITTELIDVGIANEGAAAFRIRIKNPADNSIEIYYYYHLSDLSQKKEVDVGGYKTDATTMLVQEDSSGNALSFFVHDGSYIEKAELKDKYLFKSINGNVNLSASFNGGDVAELSSEFMSVDNLANITVYTNKNILKSSYNGEYTTTMKKDGGYIYYGDTPIVSSSESIPQIPEKDDFDEFVGGGTGSSSGGGTGGAVTPPKDNVDDKTEDESKDENIIETDKATDFIFPTYNDVKVNDWHFKYVEDLTEKGIISGDGTGNFNPDSKVTREQFLKMLILASCAETEEAENTFEDVNYNDWYASYVLKAKKLGIVNGISDTEFGIGNNITRQDMAVMIARVLEIKGIKVEDSNVVGFSDAKDVSDYAKNSVKFMKSIGLIEGYNNQYRPLDNLTKAEAAKVISGLMNYLVEE